MNYFYFCNPFDDHLKRAPNIVFLMKAVMLAGGLLAVSIYSSNDLIQDKIEHNFLRIDVNEESENTDKPPQQTIYLPDYLASISSVQINVDLIKVVLFDVPFLTEIKCWRDTVPPPRITNYFRVLFLFILGPNAP